MYQATINLVLSFNHVSIIMGKRILILAAFLIFSSLAFLNAQVSLVWEPYVVHDYPTLADAGNDAEVFALDDYITWRLYAVMEYGDVSTPDFLTSVLGSGASDLDTLQITFDCCPYQNSQAGPVVSGANINAFATDFFPALLYDSWVTIGMDLSSDGGNVTFFPIPPWQNDFEECIADQIYSDGANGSSWFTLPGSDNGYADGDPDTNLENSILLGQFTVPQGCQLAQQGDGDNGSLCINYFTDSNFDLDVEVECLNLPPLNPCVNSPLITSLTESSPTLCFDECDGTALFTYSGGSGDLSSSIDQLDAVNDGFGGYSGLCGGEHIITITDNITLDGDGNACFITDTVTINQPTAPLEGTFSLITDVACANDSIGLVEIIITGGTPYTIGDPYIGSTSYGVNYEFVNPNIIQFDSLGIQSGIAFSVLDSNGCEVNFTQDVGPLGALTASGVPTDVSCFDLGDGSISLTVNDGLPNPSFTWTPSVNNETNPTNLVPGVYSVVIDDGDSCPIELDFTIDQPDVFAIENVIPNQVDCYGECTGNVTFDLIGGSEPIVTSFIQGVSNVNNGEFCAGNVIIEASDENLCFATQTVIIDEGDEIIFNALIAQIQCPNGTDGVIDIASLDGGTGELTPSIDPIIPFDNLSSSFLNVVGDTYILNVTDELDCLNDTTIIMSAPNGFIPNIDITDVSCYGLSDGTIEVAVSGGTGEVTYLLNEENPTIEGLFENLDTGNYTISGTDEAECPFSIEEPIAIEEPNQIVITELILTSPSCGGGNTATASISIEGGTPQYSIGWNLNSSTPNNNLALGLSGGNNSVQVIDANLCSIDSTFVINQPAEISYTYGIDSVFCTGMCNGNITILPSGVDPLSVTFENNLNSSPFSATDLCEGLYPFIITDNLGCILRDTIFMVPTVISDIEFTVFTTPVSCWNEGDGTATAAVTGGEQPISYAWQRDGVTIQETITAIGLIEDFYTVTITDSLGCTFSEDLFIEPTEGCFFISNALTPNGDGYNDDWVIGGLEYFPKAKVEVFNRWGQQVFESIGNYTNWDGKYNSNKLPVSDYYYVITFDPDSAPLTGTVTIKY